MSKHFEQYCIRQNFYRGQLSHFRWKMTTHCTCRRIFALAFCRLILPIDKAIICRKKVCNWVWKTMKNIKVFPYSSQGSHWFVAYTGPAERNINALYVIQSTFYMLETNLQTIALRAWSGNDTKHWSHHYKVCAMMKWRHSCKLLILVW